MAKLMHSVWLPVVREIVAFGLGLNMLRDVTSPVKERIKSLVKTSRSISFATCDNTRTNMSRVEQREIPYISQATVVSSGMGAGNGAAGTRLELT